MTKDEKLINEIDALTETIFMEWQHEALRQLTAGQRRTIRQHVERCVNDLKGLLERLNSSGDATVHRICPEK